MRSYMPMYCEKRDGDVVKFDKRRIEKAILLAFREAKEGNVYEAKKLTESILEQVMLRYRRDETPRIEEIQDLVEISLMQKNYLKTAKKYILYREKKHQVRQTVLV